jgi:hypothetical protein
MPPKEDEKKGGLKELEVQGQLAVLFSLSRKARRPIIFFLLWRF